MHADPLPALFGERCDSFVDSPVCPDTTVTSLRQAPDVLGEFLRFYRLAVELRWVARSVRRNGQMKDALETPSWGKGDSRSVETRERAILGSDRDISGWFISIGVRLGLPHAEKKCKSWIRFSSGRRDSDRLSNNMKKRLHFPPL
jgi:hypothetical protein